MVRLQQAGIKDINTIRQLALDTWPVAYGEILSSQQLKYMLDLIYSSSSLNNQMQSLQHQFTIAYDEQERPVGFSSTSAKGQQPQYYRLHKLYVIPDQQGKGTGKKLLDDVIDKARKAGAIGLELNVNRHNKAFDFYRKLGFRVISEEDIDIGNGYFMNDYIMMLDL